MNKVILKGNLTRAPEMRVLADGTAITNFGVATNKRFKTKSGEEKEVTTFVDIEAFGPRAELITKWVRKGDPILIDGELKFDQWEKDGEKRSKLTVRLNQFEFLNRKEKDDSKPAPGDEILDEAPSF